MEPVYIVGKQDNALLVKALHSGLHLLATVKAINEGALREYLENRTKKVDTRIPMFSVGELKSHYVKVKDVIDWFLKTASEQDNASTRDYCIKSVGYFCDLLLRFETRNFDKPEINPKPKRNPCHEETMYRPDGISELVSRSFPTGKLNIKGYCKYCYKTHWHWWQMREQDYGADVVLCGYCEHTSVKELVETE